MDFMNWKGWWSSLFKQAFVVPIFLFFMYLILKFLNTGFLEDKSLFTDGSWGTQILQVAVPLLIVAILLLKAKEIATSMSGMVAEYAMKAATFAGGVAGGAVLGGAALGASKIAGMTAGRLSNENMKDYASGVKGNKLEQWAARRAVTVGDFSKNNSFDIRKTAAGAAMAKQSGFNFDNGVLSTLNMGTEDTKGGSFGRESRRKLAAEEKSKKYGFNQDKWNTLDDAEKKNKEDFTHAEEKVKELNERVQYLKDLQSGGATMALNNAGVSVPINEAIIEATNAKNHEVKHKNHLAHVGHEIHDRKDYVQKERQDYIIANEKKKGGVVMPKAKNDIYAENDMTLPDGTRVRRNELLVAKDQKITNNHLKGILRELKNAGATPTGLDIYEKRFEQFDVKQSFTYQTRNAAGGLDTNTVDARKYSPKERQDIIDKATKGKASTAELNALKKNFDYINSTNTKAGEILTDIGERMAQGAGLGLYGGALGVAAGAVGGLGFGIAEVVSQLNKYNKNFAENLTRITDEAKKMAKKDGGGDHKAASTAAKPADDHGGHH